MICDVVIALGKDSPLDDLELRYALRGIQANLLDYRRIYVVGEKPSFLKNVVHIPFPDKSKYKQKNILRKILRACEEEKLSNEFMFFNDDHFLLKQESALLYPYYYTGSIESEIIRCRGDYRQSLINTLSVLKDLSTYNFDTHYPIRYNKEQFVNVMGFYDWNVPHGYVIKSLYCNTLNVVPEPALDGKIHDAIAPDKLEELVSTRSCISTSNYALTNIVKNKLNWLFPEPSVYEH
jgi:hypothetical protein